ncbi:MAG: O-antigen ligase family protein [Actinobacteria bacterium]|nr:MAG: O-antigen ligase family protein [Actinomycetota bacterium]
MIGLARLAGPVACLGLALLLLARTRRDRLAGLGFAALGAGMLAAALAPRDIAEAVGGGLGAIAVAALLAAAFRREPWLLPLLALACIPARVGALGHQLLVPLYVVVLAAAMQLGWEIAHGDARVRELRGISWPLALYLAWVGLSLGWTQDAHEGATEVLAFYVPFTILALAVARLPWKRLGLWALYAELTVMALVFAVVGFYQYETRTVFENPKVINSNAYAAFFRVNSVFWDPSVYGRFLVVAMIPSIVLIVRGRSLRVAVAAAVALVVTWFGLLISFSQSSFSALVVALIGVAFVVWRWRAFLAVGLAVVVLGGLAVAQPTVRRSIQHHTTSGLNSASSGRYNLVANGVRIAIAHPVRGVGVGGFKHAYAKRVQRLHGKKNLKTAASHDTPVTIAAETGLLGLALFAWLLVACARDIFSTRRLVPLAAGLSLAAILVHSLFYNDFFEDPTTWLLFGLVAFALPPARAPDPPPPAAQVREAVHA